MLPSRLLHGHRDRPRAESLSELTHPDFHHFRRVLQLLRVHAASRPPSANTTHASDLPNRCPRTLRTAGSGWVVLFSDMVLSSSLSIHIVPRLALLPRNPYSRVLYSTSSEYSLWKQSTSRRSRLCLQTSCVWRLQLVAAGRLRWLPLFGIRQKTSSAIISTFVSNINSTSPRPSTPIQACNASTLPMQGKGGSYSNSRDARVAPLPLHPIPPRRRFSQTG